MSLILNFFPAGFGAARESSLPLKVNPEPKNTARRIYFMAIKKRSLQDLPENASVNQNVLFNTKARFMCSLTPELAIKESSSDFLQAYGLRQSQAVGATFAELIWPEQSALIESNIRALTPEYRIMTFDQNENDKKKNEDFFL